MKTWRKRISYIVLITIIFMKEWECKGIKDENKIRLDELFLICFDNIFSCNHKLIIQIYVEPFRPLKWYKNVFK